ncbi:MAG TPA: hypothetical protein VF631_04195 [Allosphingosinicella sp.]|jgi:GGDEF domain-containing protein|uniref:hypothetical protein n=1 Tax=Allosphingosinicella sp. TaxID=2823234 RepID=UPI002F275982
MKAQPLRPAQSEAPSEGQELLDGLPIPAAELGRAPGGPALILRANDSFRSLSSYDERLRGPLVADVPLLERGQIRDALRGMFDGGASVHQFEMSDGETIGRGESVVRLARLTGTPDFPDRCLLTLLDRSAQAAPERSFRPEQARDRLTGLPNRRAFEERVGEVLGHPNFEDTSHALLSVRLVAPAEQALADELLIAAAGRLLSALRAGDLLARSGQASFAILMRLERGQPDAMELAERLGVVLAAPFRLSVSEVAAASAVEFAPLRAIT